MVQSDRINTTTQPEIWIGTCGSATRLGTSSVNMVNERIVDILKLSLAIKERVARVLPRRIDNIITDM